MHVHAGMYADLIFGIELEGLSWMDGLPLVYVLPFKNVFISCDEAT